MLTLAWLLSVPLLVGAQTACCSTVTVTGLGSCDGTYTLDDPISAQWSTGTFDSDPMNRIGSR